MRYIPQLSENIRGHPAIPKGLANHATRAQLLHRTLSFSQKPVRERDPEVHLHVFPANRVEIFPPSEELSEKFDLLI